MSRFRIDLDRLFRQWYRCAIEFRLQVQTSNGEDSWCKIDMCGHRINSAILGYTRAADKQWHTDIFFEAALLSRLQSVLTDVVAVIRGIDDVCIVEHIGFLEALDDGIYELVDCLKSPQP